MPKNTRASFLMYDINPAMYTQACEAVGIKPVQHPFWCNLSYVDIFRSVTPDILHQLHQGVIKHVLTWLKEIFSAKVIDDRCARLPLNHNLRHFSKGITMLSWVSGKEHQDICRILLGIIIDLPLSNNISPARLIRAVRGILDFVYLAQYPSPTTTMLQSLQCSLTQFHENKDIFIDPGVRSNFNIPKLHSLQHYASSIELFGA